ncbi:hypothetical protein MPER_15184 [Moniliophthora perniciosa FA553]|nr:hypothetical protein MPER_15184 [Moniliophthora perniciosa FA553]
MLTVKDVKILDLTDEVETVGKDPVGFGAFSDVWMGKWYDKVEGRERVVAIKYLRQVMVQNVREKFLEVPFRLLHRHFVTDRIHIATTCGGTHLASTVSSQSRFVIRPS